MSEQVRHVWVVCERDRCENEYKVYLSDLRRGVKRYCSQNCASKAWWEGPKGQVKKLEAERKQAEQKAQRDEERQANRDQKLAARKARELARRAELGSMGGKAVAHGAGKTGKRGCKCEPCKAKKREYMKMYHRVERLYKYIFVDRTWENEHTTGDS